MLKFFAEKMWVAFAKIVNEMTLKELVKLTTLWTTGPSVLFVNFFKVYVVDSHLIAQTCLCNSKEYPQGPQQIYMLLENQREKKKKKKKQEKTPNSIMDVFFF